MHVLSINFKFECEKLASDGFHTYSGVSTQCFLVDRTRRNVREQDLKAPVSHLDKLWRFTNQNLRLIGNIYPCARRERISSLMFP